MTGHTKGETLTIRFKPELRERMDAIRETMPYQPTITSIVERGIVLALDEMDRMRAAVDDALPAAGTKE